jgi:ABC-type cobalamin/Fe3+-siderophores transport system ATPase subunit
VSLRLDGLAVDVAGQRIVTGIDLTVSDREFAGLVGPNGSGKSTILKAIYRVYPPSAGRVLLDRSDLLAMRPKEAARRIAVVTQESTSEFDFTVREMAEQHIVAAGHLAVLPPGLAFDVAAALPVPALTADQAIDALQLQAG